MPITLNLLAEQQAAEELRRRDPVKRAYWIAGFCVAVVFSWSAWLQVKIFRANSMLAEEQAKWGVVEKDSKHISDNLKKTAEIERKLTALRSLATNRFLWATTLNALQQTLVDKVQIIHFKGEQTYAKIEQPAKGNTPKQSMAREQITLTINAKDYASPAELNYNKFISAILSQTNFQASLRKIDGVTLKDRMPPQVDPADPGKSYSLFSVECRYPDKERL